VTDGFAYHGRIAALRDKFIFGDIQRGRIFASDLAAMKKADDGISDRRADRRGPALVRDASGKRVDVSLTELIEKTLGSNPGRAEIFTSAALATASSLLTSRQDGMIRMLVPDGASTASTGR
jgi:hypothetical protein